PQVENSRTCDHSRTAAPAVGPASRTRGSMPWSTRWAAAARPAGPAPITTTGNSVVAGAFTATPCVFRHLSMACAAQHDTCIDERQHRHSSNPGDSLMEHIDVAVIGGGQSGLATAHALLRRGLRPVVLEASDRAAG